MELVEILRKREQFLTTQIKATPVILFTFVLVSLVSYVISGFEPMLIFLFFTELITQYTLSKWGVEYSYFWVVLRCLIKLMIYPIHLKYTHKHFFWILVEVHVLQLGPNFYDADFFAHFFTYTNVIFCIFVNQFYYQNDFAFTFTVAVNTLFQHHIFHIFKNVLLKKNLELEKRVSEFESVLESIQSHVFKTDLNLDILLINKEFLGKNEKYLVGSSFKNLPIFHNEKFSELHRSKKTQVYKIQVSHDSQNYLYMVTVSPIWIQQEMIGITILCNDATHELELKQKKIEHEKQIFALKSKTEFIASISHEVRNPLQALTFSIENLLSNEPRKDQIGILNEAQSSNQLINHIIGDILDSSKIESGNFQLQNKNFEILESIESALKINIPQATKKSLDFTYSIDYQIPRMIKGDSQRLIQILSNLMSNSIKYTQQGKIELHVKNKSDRNMLYFAIKDTGIGIKKENLMKIFTMFEQVSDSNTSTGWGIGLSIVKGLIELMHGKYGVESEVGSGSTFWFEIPYEITKETKTIYDSLPLSHFKTIVLVLQDEDISDDLTKLLHGMNTKNICVTKSKEKISTVFKETPDCKIFVDDDLIYQIPAKIPHDQVVIIGNSSKKHSEYNDCLRLFKPILSSDLILELSPTLKKKFSGDWNLLEGSNVLIVEDHVVIQKCIKKFIEKMSPKKVFVADNGEEALKIYKQEISIDLIITDINMPLMNGFDLVKSIKSFNASTNTKIIVATGELNNQMLREFVKQWKIDDTLLKPITYKSLITSIRNCFRKKF